MKMQDKLYGYPIIQVDSRKEWIWIQFYRREQLTSLSSHLGNWEEGRQSSLAYTDWCTEATSRVSAGI